MSLTKITSVVTVVVSLVIFSCGPELADKEYELIEQAKVFEDEGDFKNTLKAYKKLLNKYPESTYSHEALFKIGSSYFYMNDFDETSETFRQQFNNNPSGKFDSVARLMIEYGEDNKITEEELLTLAQICEVGEVYEEAIKACKRKLNDFPDSMTSDETIERIAFLYYNNIHDFKKAIVYHERLIKDYPESEFVSRARFMIGFIYANNLENYELAKQCYNEFLELHPESELSESVKWELEHLGQDVNSQLDDLFGNEKSNDKSTK
ncbi:tetratricopeptide repeat protein [candidate division KSB1 bacterium]|nr:tetratricopeptide repeat protein [candidate division KSB1 bacterium]